MRRILPYLVIIAAVVIFFPTIFFSNHTFISSGVVSTDLYLFNYPLKSLMHKSLLHGLGVPLWTDLIGNGYPIFAEGQMGEFYPLHLFFFSLPFSTIHLFNANLMLHYILTGIFTYLYIKISIKLSKKASILGALIFTFSGYMLTHLHQVNIILELTYFPLNLLIAETIARINKQTPRTKIILLFLLLTLTLYFQMTAGHIEMVYYNLLFTAICILIRFFFDHSTREEIIKKIIIGVGALLVTIMLALPQLYATYELVNFSQRESGISYETTTGTLWPPETLILFINPKAYNVYRAEPGYSPNRVETVNIGALYPYVGILPLLLTIYAIVSIFKKEPRTLLGSSSSRKMWVLTFITLLVFTYLYAVGRSTQLFSVVWETIPGMKFFRFPIKAIYIIEFCIAVLASIGVENLEELIINKTKNRETKNTQNKEILLKSNIQKIGAGQGLLGNNAGKNNLATGTILVIICICYLDLWLFNRPTQPTIPADDWLKTPEFAQYINSQDPDCQCGADTHFQNWRSYTHGTNNIDYTRIFDFALQKDLQNILHIDFNMIHDVAINKEWAVLFLQRQTLLNNFNTKIDFDTGVLTLPPELKKSLDLQSVRYLVADLEIKDPDLELVKTHEFSSSVNHVIFIANSTDSKYFPTKKAYLYKNKTYFPRLTITPQTNALYLSSEDKAAKNILDKVLSPDFDPTRETLIEKATPTANAQADRAQFTSNYKLLSYTPQELEVQVTANQPAYLALSDTYYPGWTATIDNTPTEIYKANYAFKAVAVPSGTHIVKLKFTPTHWRETIIVLIAGWSIVATTGIYLLINFLKNKKRV